MFHLAEDFGRARRNEWGSLAWIIHIVPTGGTDKSSKGHNFLGFEKVLHPANSKLAQAMLIRYGYVIDQ